jgi:YesN/AraC family two-component response regulator
MIKWNAQKWVGMIINFEEISNLSNLVSKTFNLPAFLIDSQGEIIFESNHNQALNPLYKNEKEILLNMLEFKPEKSYNFPVLRKTFFLENYIIVSIFQNKAFKGSLLIGPSVFLKIAKEKINGLINDTQPFSPREQVLNYYQSIPVIQYEKLIDISLLIYQVFNQKLLSADQVKSKNNQIIQSPEKNEVINLSVSTNLQTRAFHHDPMYEKKRLDIIKEGRLEDINEYFNFRDQDAVSVLSKSSQIRSLKNQIIVTITLATRASIEGGLHYEIALTLSDNFIQRLEDFTNFNDINNLLFEVIYTFTKKVRQVKHERYSKTITNCTNYIFNHLYENINHKTLSKLLDLSPNYLSALFKKEVGMTLTEYIQTEKIKEAKKLISYSDTSISEICSLLNFNDQSYFTKLFKKYTGITPKQYREKHHLLEK